MGLDLLWLLRTWVLTRVIRVPFARVAAWLGQRQFSHFVRVMDGALFIQLFVLYPALAIEMSLTVLSLLHAAVLVLVYRSRGSTNEVLSESVKNECPVPDWPRAKRTLYRQLKQASEH